MLQCRASPTREFVMFTPKSQQCLRLHNRAPKHARKPTRVEKEAKREREMNESFALLFFLLKRLYMWRRLSIVRFITSHLSSLRSFNCIVFSSILHCTAAVLAAFTKLIVPINFPGAHKNFQFHSHFNQSQSRQSVNKLCVCSRSLSLNI